MTTKRDETVGDVCLDMQVPESDPISYMVKLHLALSSSLSITAIM